MKTKSTMIIGALTLLVGIGLGIFLMLLLLNTGHWTSPLSSPLSTSTPSFGFPSLNLTPMQTSLPAFTLTPKPTEIPLPTATETFTPTPVTVTPTLLATETFTPFPSPTQTASPRTERFEASRYALSVNFKSNTYPPGRPQVLDVQVSIWEKVTSEMRICAQISELRKYKDGPQKMVSISEDCRTTYLKTEAFSGGKYYSSASVSFTYTPSGYSYVWITSNDETYQIIRVEAQVKLYENERFLKTEFGSHKILPVSVTNIGYNNSLAYATVQFLADNPEQSFNLKLVVTQIELDLDEAVFGILLGCALDSLLCYDVQEVASTIVPVTLQAGKQQKITVPYSSKPVTEEGNSIWGYEVALYFENDFVTKKR